MLLIIQMTPKGHTSLTNIAHIANGLAKQQKVIGRWKKYWKKKKQLLNREKLILKITQTNKKFQVLTDRTRTIILTPKEVVAPVHTLQTTMVAEVTVYLELFDLKQDLTMLTLCVTHCSHGILSTNQVSKPRNWGTKWHCSYIYSWKARPTIFYWIIPIRRGRHKKNIALSTQFPIDTGATCSIINRDTFTEIEQFNF